MAVAMKRLGYVLDVFPAVSETFVFQEILELERRGYHVEVFALARGGGEAIHPEVRALAQRTWYLPDHLGWGARFAGAAAAWSRHPGRTGRAVRAVRAGRDAAWWRRFRRAPVLAAAVRRAGIEHLHAHFGAAACEYAMLAGGLTGVPFSFTVHAYDLFERPRLLQEKVEAAHAVVTISEFNKSALEARTAGATEGKLHVIPCGIDVRYFSRNGHGRGKAQEAGVFYIVGVGRLVAKKGFGVLVEAARRLRKAGVRVRCSLIGEGPLRDTLRRQIEEAGLSGSVELLGAGDRETVRAYLERADAFVLPCVIDAQGDRDGVPVSLKEAMAMGVPVVTTTLPGLEEAVPDGAGLRVPPGDAEALAEAIRGLMAAGPDARRELGRRAAEFARQTFDVLQQADRLAAVFEGAAR